MADDTPTVEPPAAAASGPSFQKFMKFLHDKAPIGGPVRAFEGMMGKINGPKAAEAGAEGGAAGGVSGLVETVVGGAKTAAGKVSDIAGGVVAGAREKAEELKHRAELERDKREAIEWADKHERPDTSNYSHEGLGRTPPAAEAPATAAAKVDASVAIATAQASSAAVVVEGGTAPTKSISVAAAAEKAESRLTGNFSKTDPGVYDRARHALQERGLIPPSTPALDELAKAPAAAPAAPRVATAASALSFPDP